MLCGLFYLIDLARNTRFTTRCCILVKNIIFCCLIYCFEKKGERLFDLRYFFLFYEDLYLFGKVFDAVFILTVPCCSDFRLSKTFFCRCNIWHNMVRLG